jgi:hypothetical protein
VEMEGGIAVCVIAFSLCAVRFFFAAPIMSVADLCHHCFGRPDTNKAPGFIVLGA